MFSIYDGRSEFYQWDLDRKLIVNDKTIKQVHFCNRTDSCSLIRYPYEVNGVYLVDVPNVILQSDFRINVYGYDANYTKHSDKFDVIRRSKPENYVYTDEEVKCFEEATEMAAEAKAAAVAAEAKADEAYANAETAKAETAKLAFSLGNLYMDEKQGDVVIINDMRGSVQELVSYIDGYAKPGNPNILPVDLIVEINLNYNADVGDYYYIIPNLAAGTYTLYYESMVGEMIWCDGVEMFSHTPHTFTLTETKNVRLASWGMVEYIKLEEGVTWRKSSFAVSDVLCEVFRFLVRKHAWIPCCHDVTAAVRIILDRINQICNLVDAFVVPVAPLCTVDRTEAVSYTHLTLPTN